MTSNSASHPPVSVVIPSYNREDVICRCVDSVLAQTVSPDEIIVVDDGSSDQTRTVLRDHYGDRIRYVYQENRGVAGARNTGIQEANNELIAFLDSDDTWMPRKLELQLPAMSDPRVVLSATNWCWFDRPDESIFEQIGLRFEHEPEIQIHPLLTVARMGRNCMLLQTCICRAHHLRRVGGCDERLRFADDTRLLFRMAAEGAFAIFSTPLLLRDPPDVDGKLTQTSSLAYQREHVDAIVEILLESYGRAAHAPAVVRKTIRRLTAFHLSRQARHHALDGDYSAARRRFLESLVFCLRGQSTAKSLVGLVSPRLFAAFSRRALK